MNAKLYDEKLGIDFEGQEKGSQNRHITSHVGAVAKCRASKLLPKRLTCQNDELLLGIDLAVSYLKIACHFEGGRKFNKK